MPVDTVASTVVVPGSDPAGRWTTTMAWALAVRGDLTPDRPS